MRHHEAICSALPLNSISTGDDSAIVDGAAGGTGGSLSMDLAFRYMYRLSTYSRGAGQKGTGAQIKSFSA